MNKMIRKDLHRSLERVSRDIESMQDPEDVYIIKISNARTEEEKQRLSAEFLESERKRLADVAAIIAEETGADIEQIIDINKRTAEQQMRILQLTGSDTIDRLFWRMNSNHAYMGSALDKLYEDQQDDRPADVIEQEQTVFIYYYLASHPDIKASGSGYFQLYPEEEKTFVDLYKKFRMFVAGQTWKAETDVNGFILKPEPVMEAFAMYDSPKNAKDIIEAFLPMVQGTATNQFRLTATKNIKLDLNGNATIEQEGFKAFMQGYSKLKGGLSTGVKKLLDAGALRLTEINHYRPKEGQHINTAVSIPLKQYGLMRGYDLNPRVALTPDEKQQEDKRIENLMHNVRKKAKAELDVLYSVSLSWTEPGKKNNANFRDVRILQSKGIENGYINMRFSEDMATYLVHAYIMQYPTALQTVDERNPRTYNVGYKLAYHHSNDNNRIKGTANIISVQSLLNACDDIPTYEGIQASKNRGHWDRLIKDPLEKALENNTDNGVISMWEYSNSRGIPLNASQISIPDYQTFANLYVHFEMINEPDQGDRLQRKNVRKEKNKSKTQKNKKKPQKGKK